MCKRYADGTILFISTEEYSREPFENVGFSKKGKECLYNILIMEELHDIIAVGAGTSSKIVHQEDHQVDRIENLKDIKQYITRIDEIIHRKELDDINRSLIMAISYGRTDIETPIHADIKETISHGIIVSNLAYLVGKELGLTRRICYDLAVAGMV